MNSDTSASEADAVDGAFEMMDVGAAGVGAAAGTGVGAEATEVGAIGVGAADAATPLISVIIPVYNVEDYLGLSLASVCEQTLSDIEILCVNDGSTDRSPLLLEAAAAMDDRIRIIEKPNGGLSSARNAGIDAARGRYVCFLDSDDLMKPEACEIIVATFEATDADVVTYGAEVYPPFWATHWTKTILSPRDAVYDGFDADLLFKENSHPYAWRTACDRAFLVESGVRFDETLAFGEDQVFHFQLYPRSRRTVLIADKLVEYRVVRPGSLMNQRAADPFHRTIDHIEIIAHILDDWDEQGFLDDNAQAMFTWLMEFVALDVISAEGDERTALLERLRSVLSAHFAPEFLDRQRSHPLHGYIAEELFGVDGAAYEGRAEALKQRYYDDLFGPPAPEPKRRRSLRETMNDTGQRLLRRVGISADFDEGRQARRVSDIEERSFEFEDRVARAHATARLGVTLTPLDSDLDH